MVHVIATITAEPGRRAELLAAFADLVPLVRAEHGCIEYGAGVDLPTSIKVQIPERLDVFTVVEKWADLPALEAHLAAPHMTAYRERTASLVESVVLQVLRPV